MSDLILLTLTAIANSPAPLDGELRVQCLANDEAQTSGGKPYRKLTLSDGTLSLTHSVWSDAHAYTFAAQMQKGACYALTGAFSKSNFGLESKGWGGRRLEADETAALFAGPPALREKQERDWLALQECVAGSPASVLRDLAALLLSENEAAYRRAAAARGNHHARRGGLVEHVSLMAQQAVALCGVYPELRRDLLVAGVVFHDVGKIVENQYETEGFDMPYSFAAECYGHIAIGVLMAHNLWRRLPEDVQKKERTQLDALCHLILSHHGQLDWGSPVEPKLPEAVVLHFIDNTDAKLEMLRAAKTTAKTLAPGVIERVRPFSHNLLVTPPSA